MKKLFFLFACLFALSAVNAAFYEVLSTRSTSKTVTHTVNSNHTCVFKIDTEAYGKGAFAFVSVAFSNGTYLQGWKHGWYNSGNGGVKYGSGVATSVKMQVLRGEHGYYQADATSGCSAYCPGSIH